MEHLEVFHLPPLPSLLSTVYQCDGCLSSWGVLGLMAGLSGFASHESVTVSV